MPSGPSDITLAVGDGARRMTYAQLADMRRISAASAERLVRRKGWVRTTGNDGVVRILVPLLEARKTSQRTKSVRRTFMSGQADSPGDNALVRTADISVVRTLEAAVSALSAQLEHERDRASRAEDRVEALYAALIDERRRVIEILTGSARRPWWRRWFR
jgi:hypothetical protein